MLYTGIDMVEIVRIERALERWGPRLLARVFTPAEQALCAGRPASFAGRWAAKEAAAKALGTGIRGLAAAHVAGDIAPIGLLDAEILRGAGGRPELHLHHRAAAHARRLGVTELAVSISHTATLAVACVVIR